MSKYARSDAGSVGPAGSLAVVLARVYYSAMILLLGAKSTQAYGTARPGDPGGGVA